MKLRSTLFFVLLMLLGLNTVADNFSFLAHTVKQPNGIVIHCYVSGDEYFNWLHNENGYTIIQGDDGYFYWGTMRDDIVVPSVWRIDTTDPSRAGLKKWAKISQQKYNERRALFTENLERSVRAPHTGNMNNLVVYIRFNDDTEFTTTRQAYDDKFNPPAGNSLKSYFSEVSYELLTISSTHYPECLMTTNFSYQDPHDRSYFEPYNATTNPNGYNGNTQRTQREHTLLKDAITWINANSPVPSGINIDGDEDGRVDNVCFIIRGGNGAWAELLWAHRWALFSYDVFINGKRVYDYTFQPETQVAVKTLCHEMFHALGSPDLYHYTSNGISPAGAWDIMDGGSGSMTAYMKWKYSQNTWITTIPEITTSGNYTLHPLTTAANNCYKIASPYSPDQYFVVEYRKKTGTFEGSLPGSGLIVYRIDPSITGNASGPPDELYVYRPGGTLSTNGSTASAFFSAGSGRTEISDGTNPSSFLQDGSAGGLDISNVTAADSTISFSVRLTYLADPADFAAAPVSASSILLNWQNNPSGNDVMIVYNTTGEIGTPVDGETYQAGDSVTGGGYVIFNGSGLTFQHTGLSSGTHYYYKAWSVLPANDYSPGVECDAFTLCESIVTLPFAEGFEAASVRPECWFEEGTDPEWQYFSGNGPGIGAGYPAAAHEGVHNACLKDATTTADLTTLVTPVINASGYTDIQLSFWLYMQKWGSRQDELGIYYRANPSSSWVLLQSYIQSVSAWTEQIIPLPAGLTEFQIGFTGNARSGFGICIDDITITGAPVAMLSITPANRNVNMSAGSATFSVSCTVPWTAASDAPEWCTVTPSGTGDGEIIAIFTENTLYSQRVASITVAVGGVQSQTVTVTQNASNISVDELSADGIVVFPNPAKGYCTVVDEQGGGRIQEITMVDFTGRVLASKKGNGEAAFEFDLSSFANGTYTLKLKTEHAEFFRKLIIVR